MQGVEKADALSRVRKAAERTTSVLLLNKVMADVFESGMHLDHIMDMLKVMSPLTKAGHAELQTCLCTVSPNVTEECWTEEEDWVTRLTNLGSQVDVMNKGQLLCALPHAMRRPC